MARCFYKFHNLPKDVLAKSIYFRTTYGRSFERKIRTDIKKRSLCNTVLTQVCSVENKPVKRLSV